MPYAIKKSGQKWLVVKKDSGEKVATHDSEAKARAQMRLLQGIEHGWHPDKS